MTQQEQPVERFCDCEDVLGYIPERCTHGEHCGKQATPRKEGEKA